MADNVNTPGGNEPLKPNEDALEDLELTEDPEAEDLAGGRASLMCTTIADKQ